MVGRKCALILEVRLLFLFFFVVSATNGCSSTEFQCTAGQCIPGSYQCDGEGDCPDSSDEKNCHSSGCLPNEFPCANSKCIPYLYRCDEDNDCGDMSDEKCDPFLDNFLIVAETGRHKDLYQIHLATGVMVPLKVGQSKLNAVAFDGDSKTVYWTDVDAGMIRRYSLAGGNRTKIIETIFTISSSSTGALEGLALDVVNEKLYYCQADSTGRSPGLIGEMSLNGTNHRIVISERGQPRSIVLDTVTRLMYWTDWGTTPAIVRARMDNGGERTVLVGSNIKWPNALAIDFTERILYWGDAWYHRIESIDLSGKGGRRVVLSEPSTNASYFAFALSPDFLYVTDRRQRSVRKFDLKTSRIHSQTPIDIFDRLNGIMYYNSNATSSTIVKKTSAMTSPPVTSLRQTTIVASRTTASPQQPVGTRRSRTTSMTSQEEERLQPTTGMSGTDGRGWTEANDGSNEAIHDSTVVTVAVVVVVLGIVVMTIVITIGVVVVKAKRSRNRLLLEKRLVVPPTDRGRNSYNYTRFAAPVGGSTTSCSEDGDNPSPSSSSSLPAPRGPASRSDSFKPILVEDALVLNNIYSTVVGDYENLNTYEVIDDSLM